MHLEISLGKVVIGSSIEALLYAFFNKYKILYTRNLKPDNIEEVEDFGLGQSKVNIWNFLAFQLGLGGYFPFEEKIKHIKYVDANTLKIVTKEESIIKVSFEKLYIFDDHNILDLPPYLKTTNSRVRIVDWFYAERGCLHEYELIENKTDFMNQVIFFKNSRKKTARRKDVCVVSYCKKQDLEKYPEHLVRIKTEQLMKDLGIETATKFKTYIKIIHMNRDIVDYGHNIYENFDNVEFMYDDAKFIYDINQRRVKIDYMKYLRLKLGIKC